MVESLQVGGNLDWLDSSEGSRNLVTVTRHCRIPTLADSGGGRLLEHEDRLHRSEKMIYAIKKHKPFLVKRKLFSSWLLFSPPSNTKNYRNHFLETILRWNKQCIYWLVNKSVTTLLKKKKLWNVGALNNKKYLNKIIKVHSENKECIVGSRCLEKKMIF
jgi:hypothetical protein